MKISIVTINYNGSEDTINLLKSLENQSDPDFRIIVVDNASEESDFERLKSALPIGLSNLGLIRNSQNLGFSGGCNTGIRQAQETGSEWVVLLNNDAWVEKDFIERLRPILSTRRGIIGIPILEGGRTAYCGKIEWLKPTLSHIYNAKEIFNFQFSIFNKFSKFKIQNSKFYTIGGAMAAHKDVFEKIGPLDEKYFLYFEDADFSIRAKKAGFDISIAPDNCMVYHTVSASTKKLGSPLLLRYHYRNAFYFNLKNGPWYIKLAVWSWSWIISIKQFIKIAIKQNTEESKAILNGVLDFYLHRFGKIK